MLPPPDFALAEYHVSGRVGFLSDDLPLRLLPDSYYEPWEAIGQNLPELIKTVRIREEIDKLPILSTARLRSEIEWRRAYVLLSFMTQGHVWAGEKPAETLPPSISCPLIAVSSHLGLPPVATCAALNLWNFAPLSRGDDLSDPDNLVALQTFTGTADESWFYVVSDAMEACGGRTVPTMLGAMDSARAGDALKVSEALRALAECLQELTTLLGRMYEKCDPLVFYSAIRPMLAGGKNASAAGLPRGVFYDEGEGKGKWRQLSGASNAQSSLIPFFDIVLGVEHRATGQSKGAEENGFVKEMRSYMPKQHAKFLANLCQNTIRDFVMTHCTGHPVVNDYNAALTSLAAFRNKHLQIITRYIILPSKANIPRETHIRVQNGPKPSIKDTSNASDGKALIGTAGSQMVPFLKQMRDETRGAIARDSY